jgi:protein-S-isoprenylcysteine O-methyltransferase Ste14
MLRKPSGLDLLAVTPFQWIACLGLGVAGQSLNAGIFNAIGHAGVYYGFKLGHQIPWVNGFPFNVVSHPQYVGAVLSVWGATALAWSQAPVGLGFIALYWTGLYVITGWMESSLHI